MIFFVLVIVASRLWRSLQVCVWFRKQWYNPTSLQSVHMHSYNKEPLRGIPAVEKCNQHTKRGGHKWLIKYQKKPKRRAYNAGQLYTELSVREKVGKEMVAIRLLESCPHLLSFVDHAVKKDNVFTWFFHLNPFFYSCSTSTTLGFIRGTKPLFFRAWWNRCDSYTLLGQDHSCLFSRATHGFK